MPEAAFAPGQSFQIEEQSESSFFPHDPNVHISPLDEGGVKAANLSSTTGKSEEGVDAAETTI
ncbi:hypothetical protein [Candidatus Coxiella mudrowiae]|uniref:hypothetical protein n=1 Tax=Candidatus Coxiella mudrowiae TaxID=2054173 RepID=UPI000C2906AD|nr:hypothetical protein [Candidatus Coxiella mudrowiae]